MCAFDELLQTMNVQMKSKNSLVSKFNWELRILQNCVVNTVATGIPYSKVCDLRHQGDLSLTVTQELWGIDLITHRISLKISIHPDTIKIQDMKINRKMTELAR